MLHAIMMMSRHFRLATMAALVAAGSVQAGMITLTLSPSSARPKTGATFALLLQADIEEPVLGFGLDLAYDPEFVVITQVRICAPFRRLPAGDGDGLAGLAWPSRITGHQNLAEVTMRALAPGSTSIDCLTTPDDLTEGFPEFGGDWASLSAQATAIEIRPSGGGEPPPPVPEPATCLVLGVGALLGLLRRRH